MSQTYFSLKTYFLSLPLILGINGVAAQIIPNISVPYIPVTKAQPISANLSELKQQLAEESSANAHQLYQELTRRYQEQVLNVDLLPLRKKYFAESVNVLVAQQQTDLKANPHAYLGDNSYCGRIFTQRMNEVLDAALIQSYKEEYRRVREWEMYLRDKNQLDLPYKNGTQPTGLTNRQAISALYGVDQPLFDKINWK